MDLLQRFITIQDRSILVSSALFPFFLKKALYVLLLSRTIIYNKEDGRQLHCKDSSSFENRKSKIGYRDIVKRASLAETTSALSCFAIFDLRSLCSLPYAMCPMLCAVTHFILDRKICLCCYLKIRRRHVHLAFP